ncbi:MAG: hypothetical protein AAGJ68_00485, partial [Pseudomonadota bacterium]
HSTTLPLLRSRTLPFLQSATECKSCHEIACIRSVMVNQNFLAYGASFGFRSPGMQLGMVNKAQVEKEPNAL